MRAEEIDVSKLKTGDVFLQHTTFSWAIPLTRFSSVIRKLTRSKRNHTSECLIIEGKPYMIESMIHGVTLRTWDDFLKVKVKRDFLRLRYSRPFYNDERDYIIKGLAELDKKYDWHGMIKMFFFVVNNDWNQYGITSEKEWRCSEFTARMKDLNFRQRYMPKNFADNKDFIVLGQ